MAISSVQSSGAQIIANAALLVNQGRKVLLTDRPNNSCFVCTDLQKAKSVVVKDIRNAEEQLFSAHGVAQDELVIEKAVTSAYHVAQAAIKFFNQMKQNGDLSAIAAQLEKIGDLRSLLYKIQYLSGSPLYEEASIIIQVAEEILIFVNQACPTAAASCVIL